VSTECETTIVDHCTSLYENDISACLDFLNLLVGGLCNYDALPDMDDILRQWRVVVYGRNYNNRNMYSLGYGHDYEEIFRGSVGTTGTVIRNSLSDKDMSNLFLGMSST
jgi:hypothetical protein